MERLRNQRAYIQADRCFEFKVDSRFLLERLHGQPCQLTHELVLSKYYWMDEGFLS